MTSVDRSVEEVWTVRQSVRLRFMVLAVGAAVSGSGCSSMVSRATVGMADSLGHAVRSQNDPETVRQAAPAFLVLVDGMIAEAPEDVELLTKGAELYSSYTAAFVDDAARARRLSDRGRDYGLRALCEAVPATCGFETVAYPDFERALTAVDPDEVSVLYAAAGAWATWIQARRDDWNAVADKARVDAMIRRVIDLDPTLEDGGPYLYVGVLETLLPKALGGRPDEGRAAFERAFEMSGGRNLMAKVLLAREVARQTFDRELHDRLCREVLAAPVEAPGLTLSNALAQQEATRLLETSEEWFGE
jgi:hypothetical protein